MSGKTQHTQVQAQNFLQDVQDFQAEVEVVASDQCSDSDTVLGGKARDATTQIFRQGSTKLLRLSSMLLV